MTAFLSAHAEPIIAGLLTAITVIGFAIAWPAIHTPEPRHRRPTDRERQRAEDDRTVALLRDLHAQQYLDGPPSLAQIDGEVSATLGHALIPLWDSPPPVPYAPHLQHHEDPRVVAAAMDDDWPVTDDDLADGYVGDGVWPGERLPDEPGDRLALHEGGSQGQPPDLYDREADHWSEQSIIMPAVQG